jgi:hypothetical protein
MGDPRVGSLDREEKVDGVGQPRVRRVHRLRLEPHARAVGPSVVLDQAKRPRGVPRESDKHRPSRPVVVPGLLEDFLDLLANPWGDQRRATGTLRGLATHRCSLPL